MASQLPLLQPYLKAKVIGSYCFLRIIITRDTGATIWSQILLIKVCPLSQSRVQVASKDRHAEAHAGMRDRDRRVRMRHVIN